MIFKKLELINFKSHVNTVLDFNNGISLIIGENGAGKSSVFEAITFALFKESHINNIDLVRTNKGLADRIKMEVKLTFNIDGTDYRVERIVIKNNNKASSDARLFKVASSRDETITMGTRNVDNEIKELLNMDSKTFLNAIHIRQGEISGLIDEKPAERKKLIGRLLRIDDLEKAYDEIPSITKDYELKKGRLEGQIGSEEELSSELETLDEEQKTIQTQINELNVELEKTKKKNEIKAVEKENLVSQKSKLDTLKVKYDAEEENLKKLNESKEDLENKYDKILSNEQEMETLKPFCEKLVVLNGFKESLLNYNNLKKDEASKTEIIEKISGYKNTISEEKENYEKYVKLDEEIRELDVNLTQLNAEIKASENLESDKAQTEKDIEENSKLLSQTYEDCKSVLINYESCKDIDFDTVKLNELEKAVEKIIDEIKAEIQLLDDQIDVNKSKTTILNQEIKSSKKPLSEIKKVENKCPTCQSDISEDKKNELINTYEAIISDNKKEIDELKESEKTLSNEKTSKNNELSEIESIKSNINRNSLIPEQIERLNDELTAFDEKIKELKEKIEKQEELSKLLDEKLAELKTLETSYKSYVDAETLLNNQEDEENIKNELIIILESKKQEETQLNELIKIESSLSLDVDEEDLTNEINELAEKNDKYNVLAGTVKDKEEYETKIKENEQEIKDKETEIESLKKKIETCTYDEKTHEATNKQVEELENAINDLNTKIAVNTTNLQYNENKINETKAKIEENKKYIEEFKSVSDYLELLEDFRQHYGKNGIQKDLRSQAKPLIQKYTREFFEKFNFNYSDLMLGDEYDISIYGPEGEVKINMVSGGEKIAIALSLRLAITQVMSQGNIETILLDEPTIHLDSFRRQELINVLRSMSIIPQMIIVTHDSELETAADTLIKIEKVDGISKVIDD